MTKKILIVVTFAVFLLVNTTNVSAVSAVPCLTSNDQPDGTNSNCKPTEFCLPSTKDPASGTCTDATVRNIFGQIQPPPQLKGFITKDTTSGAGAISQFLSNLIVLIYSLAGVVLIFMLIWGAFEWLTSGGDKEHLAAAQKRIINAVIGILLFAVAFAIIRVLGVFTGFTFFTG